MNHSFVATGTRRQHGFTLLELSVVLVIIGLIIGAVTIGQDVQRNASYQRVASEFVQGWAIGYDTFATNNGIVIGDTPANPTGMVNAATGSPLCGDDLRGAMQAAGLHMPDGRAAGSETLASYLDSNGLPQQLEICFENVNWSVPGATVGTYVVRTRNVMTLTGLTPSLAKLLDNHFDGRVDARFGKFREQSAAANTGTTSVAWSANEPALDESQSPVMDAYLLMNE
ncbi:MAG TPA: prepilin-type N-terminal cleavage/methylation domain-containing protein [Rhodanobacteraceae bacterium]|nr:prepilin-type N-terminal cleavage/methylation domain-containing protein [Rhodanobacteraceae bacterium]